MVRTGEGLEEGRWRKEAEVREKERGELERGATGKRKGEGSSLSFQSQQVISSAICGTEPLI